LRFGLFRLSRSVFCGFFLSLIRPGAHGLQDARGVMAAAHGHLAAAADFQNFLAPSFKNLDEPFDLAFHAGQLNHQRLRVPHPQCPREKLRH
jgi:hypothetical protein